MSGEVTRMHVLLHQGIETINAIVTELDMDDAHYAVGKLREHLAARAWQTAPMEQRPPKLVSMPPDEDFSDLLGQ